MNGRMFLAAASLAAFGLATSVSVGAAPSAAHAQSPGSAAKGSAQRALVNQYCASCHNPRTRSGGLSLDGLDMSRVESDAAVWEKVVRKLRGGLMPPPGLPRPDGATYDGLAAWLENELDRAAEATPHPGRTETFHRLNRAEYQNAIRDLLAVEVDVVSLLPADDASYGFDNIAGVLKLDQSRFERYLEVATKISRTAVGWPVPHVTAHEVRAPAAARQYDQVDGLPFGTRGGMLIRHYFPQDAEYAISVELLCRLQGGSCDGSAGFADEHRLEVLVDKERVGQFVLEPHDRPKDDLKPYEVRVRVKAGPHVVGATFKALPNVEEVESRRERFQRPFFLIGNVFEQNQVIWQPYVDKVTIRGPFDPTGPGDTPSRRRIFACRPSSRGDEGPCAKKILSSLAERAYRRPVSNTDVDRLMTFFEKGREEGGFEAGIVSALERLLMNPEFLFRIERDSVKSGAPKNYAISDLELASRLSFFLWSSIPDQELLNTAREGRLRRPGVLAQQVERMLKDERSEALIKNFVGQWLQLRNLDVVSPSVPLFPDFDDGLREAFRQETELFVGSILRENRSVVEVLTADYTFVNERLARYYGMTDVMGSHFRRISLAGQPRRGLLGHASILTVTSRPNRTSPVVRGKWILETILGTPPPPPPPAVPPLPEKSDQARRAGLPMREQMAQHRSNPVCAGCHSMIDPLGFALENFDAVGRWRDVDDGFRPIDASGNLPGGTKFDGLSSFQAVLSQRPERFAATVAEKLLIYALGRGLEVYDMPAVRKIVHTGASNDYTLSSLVLGVVNSLPFQFRRTAPPVPAGRSARAGQ